ncbi:M15 family metallopeptidase [Flavobacterium selenitireducens]|uniref:M15 family metallopeptidase n=1 Tax=Flavobacterium selenitireducens TaxID=2722704 RepID=UPI00168BC626|nr:M15 family metallopeptidase [Flavobacterium selenitireducens]MBD3580942.1 M15 family metallopeptidase [Flavobacterium selenitireducens]
MHIFKVSVIFIAIATAGCKSSRSQSFEGVQPEGDIIATATFPKVAKAEKVVIQPQGIPPTPDSTFVSLSNYSADFVYDMKYATTDNFLKTQVYNCGECYLRHTTALALIAAQRDFMSVGYRIKIYDCYRPLDIQKKMWKIVPDANYVANPAKGSVHNRGGAVDISLVDASGNELDMGTAFDHFGPEAAIDYKNASKEVQDNRALLQTVMRKHGFSVLKSEWWHFDHEGATKFKVSNFKWDCPN